MEKILIAFLAGGVVAGLAGAAGIILYKQKTARILSGEFYLPLVLRGKEFFKYALEAGAGVNAKIAVGKRYEEINKNLKKLKLEGRGGTGKFLFYEELSALIGLGLGSFLLSNIFWGIVVGGVAFFVPAYILKTKIRARGEKILNELPDAMDIVLANVEGGVSLSQALFRYCAKHRNVFSDEMLVSLKEIQFGKSFEQALEGLAFRMELKEISNFTNVFIQAEKMGGNIKKILKGQAEDLRNKRFQELKRKAYQAPVKLLIPLIIFIFPVIFIVLFGPIVLKLMSGF
ncbi:MAG: type II secretion system F family protein [bacterium]